MKSIQRILKATGMSQEMLADFLLVRRQSLMDAATGRKSLGGKSSLKLSRLEGCIENAINAIATDRSDRKKPADPPAGAERQQAARLAYCNYRAIVLQKKLDDHEKNRSKYNLFLKVLELMNPETEFEEKWIEVRKLDANKKLKNCSEANCSKLKKQLHLLVAEADYISRQLEKQHEEDETKTFINNNLKTTNMEYSINNLTSAEAGDAILNELKSQRELLRKDKELTKPLLECAVMTWEEVNADLMNEWNALEDIEARAEQLPDMPEKKQLVDHINVQFKELTVMGRDMLRSITKAILRKQYELACVQRQLIENVRCVKAVRKRMMEMGG